LIDRQLSLIRWVEDGFSFRDTAFHRRAKAAIGGPCFFNT
jgi:hypothetical protein